jgi:hypothetical protein
VQAPPQEKLCRSLFGIFQTDPGGKDWKAKLKAESSIVEQLETLAGGKLKIAAYCTPYVRDMFQDGSIPDPFGPDGHGWQPFDPGPNAQDNQGGPPAPGPGNTPSATPSASSNANP